MAYSPAAFDPTTMHGQDFTTASDFDHSVWSNVFGSGFWFSHTKDGVWITSNQSSKWPQSGFMEATTGATSGFGYGTFHFRSRSGQAGQGAGINLILWPATGVWFPAEIKGQYSEMDVEEDWSSKGAPTATMHYDSAAAGVAAINGQSFHGFKFSDGGDDTSLRDYDFVWKAGSIALYCDGVLQWEDTGPHVPVDAAHGGMNRTLGAQVVIQTTIEPLPTIQLMLANCWWCPSTAAPGAASAPASPVPVTPVSTVPSAPASPASGTGSTSSSGSTTSAPAASSTSLSASVAVLPTGLSVMIAKATGAINTIRLSFGKTALVLADNAPDRTHTYQVAAPAPGSYSGKVTLDGSTATASVSFTVPAATTPAAPSAPTAPVITDILAALPGASASALAAVRTALGISA